MIHNPLRMSRIFYLLVLKGFFPLSLSGRSSDMTEILLTGTFNLNSKKEKLHHSLPVLLPKLRINVPMVNISKTNFIYQKLLPPRSYFI